jgi:hypothetical protein
MEERKKTKEEFIKEFEKLHKDFITGKEGFIGDDYVPLRKKKMKKTKIKRKCKK